MKISYLFILLAVILSASCQKKNDIQTQGKTHVNNTESTTNKTQDINYLSVDEVYKQGKTLANTDINVEGVIEHVCHHTWKRFKIVDAKHGEFELKIELGENFDTVNNRIIGKNVKVKGRLVPYELDAEMVKNWETKMRKNHKGEEDTEHFKEELAMIQGIHAKIISGEIDHFTTYSVAATSYELY